MFLASGKTLVISACHLIACRLDYNLKEIMTITNEYDRVDTTSRKNRFRCANLLAERLDPMLLEVGQFRRILRTHLGLHDRFRIIDNLNYNGPITQDVRTVIVNLIPVLGELEIELEAWKRRANYWSSSAEIAITADEQYAFRPTFEKRLDQLETDLLPNIEQIKAVFDRYWVAHGLED